MLIRLHYYCEIINVAILLLVAKNWPPSFCVICSLQSLLLLSSGNVCTSPFFGIICPLPNVWIRLFRDSGTPSQLLYVLTLQFWSPGWSWLFSLFHCCSTACCSFCCIFALTALRRPVTWVLMHNRMMICPVVGIVGCAWPPIKMELFLLFPVVEWVVVQVHCFGGSRHYFVGNDTISSGVVCLDWCWWLQVSHFS